MEVENMSIIEHMAQTIARGHHILMHGPGGTGKTFAIKALAKELTNRGYKVYCTATTGIAAINLTDDTSEITGKTLHSWSGIGMGEGGVNHLIGEVKKNKAAVKRWRHTSVLIIDEISMLSAELFDTINEIGKHVRATALDRQVPPFGGIRLVLSGDFLQLPPVKGKWLFLSSVFGDLAPVYYSFEEPKRYEDAQWFEVLMRLRRGSLNADDQKLLESRHDAYNQWLEQRSNDIRVIKPTVLHSKKDDVEYQNTRELDALPGDIFEFDCKDIYSSRLRPAKKSVCMAKLNDTIPAIVKLKVGAQVMLKYNMDLESGLANGSRGVVMAIEGTTVKVKWLNGSITAVTPWTWFTSKKKASRTQIPLILAWSLTIHKCQGLTLDYAICDIGASVFSPGQAYVALSRIRNSTGVMLSSFIPRAIRADPTALDYVTRIESS